MKTVNTEELDTLHDWAGNHAGGGVSRHPGMSYEEGIMAVIEWIRGEGNRPDLEE